jgi:hypothetical protein
LRLRKPLWLPICFNTHAQGVFPGWQSFFPSTASRGRVNPLKASRFQRLSTGIFFTRFALGSQGEKMGKALTVR